MKSLFKIFLPAFRQWREDKAPRLGAALAYYTVLSLPPLVILLVGIAGLALGREVVQGRVVSTTQGLMGPRGAELLQQILLTTSTERRGWFATLIGFGTLVLAASGVFGQLKDALNSIWGVEPKPGVGFLGYLRRNLFSVLTLVGTGFLLLVSLAVNGLVAALGDVLARALPGGETLWQIVNTVVALVVIGFTFALIFKLVPDVKVRWRDVWVGAFVTALLFVAGEWALGFYIGRTNVGSAFGAAGSLIVLLVWVYYSSQILFFGAEYTRAWAREVGAGARPGEDAVPVSQQDRELQGIPRRRAG